MGTRKKAFSYIRMSTDSQLKGDSRRRQLEYSKEIAFQRGYEFIDSLEDIGVSAYKGKNIKEGELGRFREILESGEIDATNTVLLVESLDRLSRENVLDAFEELNKFLRTGITIITTADNQEFTKKSLGSDIGKLYSAIGVMIRANEESLIKSRRLKSAWKSKRDNIKKRKLTAKAPLWLKLNKARTEFELREDRVDTVKKIFDLCIDEGMGTYTITRYLNENSDLYPRFSNKSQSEKPRTRPDWYMSYIRKILTNPSVYGFFQPHIKVDGKQVADGNPIEDYYPSIISKDRFLLAQSKLSQRRTSGAGRKGPTFANLFTTLVECGSCGSSVVFLNKGKPPKGGKYLKCRNAELKSNCSAPLWKYDQFENSFFEFISEIDWDEIFKKGDQESQRKMFLNESDVLSYSISEQSVKLETLTSRLSDPRATDAVLENLYRTITKIQTELENNKDRREEIRVHLAELDYQNQNQEDFVKEFRKIIKSNLGEGEKKALRRRVHNQINNVVDRILLHNDLGVFNPWEFRDFSPSNLLDELEKKDIKSDSELEDFFDSDYGRRILSDSLRSFRVVFKNGTEKTVSPDTKTAYMSVSKDMATFIRNVKKRQKEQERKSRKKKVYL